MLADPKSDALITNFTGQWLSVRALQTSEPVVNLFPDFDDNLRAAFKRESSCSSAASSMRIAASWIC